MNIISALFVSAILCGTIALPQRGPTNSQSELFLAVSNCDVEQMEQLLKNGVNPNVRDIAGKITSMTFPLYVAIIKKTSDCNKIVKLLIDAGADVNARDEHKFLPLGYAIAIAGKTGDSSIAKLLIEKNANVNLLLMDNLPPILFACHYGVIDVIEMLIEHGADVNAAEGMEKDTALHTVVRSPEIDDNKKYAIVELLINNGANVNVENIYHKTPIAMATDDKVKKLLESKGAQYIITLPKSGDKVYTQYPIGYL